MIVWNNVLLLPSWFLYNHVSYRTIYSEELQT